MTIAFWRDVSVVWLSLFCFVGLAIPLVALYFAVRGLNAAHRKTISGLRQAQRYSRTVQEQSDVLSQRVSAPLIRAHGQATRWRMLVRRLWPG